jgi:hypothetical protein
METVCSSEMLVSTYESTWHHNPEQQNRHLHCHENLKSHKLNSSFQQLGYLINSDGKREKIKRKHLYTQMEEFTEIVAK